MAEIATLATVLSAAAGAGATAYGVSQSQKAAKKASSMTPPKPQDAVRMPDEEDPRVKAERERKMRERAAAGGSESTDMARGAGTAYSNTLLGD